MSDRMDRVRSGRTRMRECSLRLRDGEPGAPSQAREASIRRRRRVCVWLAGHDGDGKSQLVAETTPVRRVIACAQVAAGTGCTRGCGVWRWWCERKRTGGAGRMLEADAGAPRREAPAPTTRGPPSLPPVSPPSPLATTPMQMHSTPAARAVHARAR